MKKLFMKKFLCLCGLALAFTGCYRDEIDVLKAEVDALRINDLETMVSNMGSSVKDLMALKDVLDPAVKELQEQKDEITKQIASMEGKMGQDEESSTEMQAQLVSLQSQLSAIEAALEAINQANLSSRIDELKAFVNTANSDLKGRIDALDAAQQTFATAAALAELQEAVRILQDDFDAEFLAALNRNADEIMKWISDESSTIITLFGDYYTNKQVDAMLDILSATDAADEAEIKAMQKQVNDLDADLRKIIEDAINGVDKKLSERIGSAEAKLESLTTAVDGLEKRIEALEKLYDVIGDYSGYKSNLIADIRALEAAAGDNGTLTSLVNTLKLILTTTEGNYYDLAEIVTNIVSNTSSAADHEKRLAYLEDLVGTLAGVEALNGLDEQIDKLSSLVAGIDENVNNNARDIEELVERVDEIVSQWSDDVFYQIQDNADDLAELKQQAINLQAAIDKAVSDGQDADKKEREEVLGLISKINESIAALILREELAEKGISDINEAIKKINSLLEECNVGEVKGLQNCLTNLDSRIKSLNDEIAKIWAVIGTEELAIKGSLINAINIINAKFGDLGGKTVKEILDALNADLAIINTGIADIQGNDPQGQSLTSLKALIDNLTTVVGGKADTSTVETLKQTVGELQQGLKDFIEKYNKNLEDYLLKADAATTYATISAVNEYINLYGVLVGTLSTNVETILGQVAALNLKLTGDESSISGYNDRIGTIEGNIVTLNGKIGSGSFTSDWTTDLIAAVNKLHELVGDKTVTEQATEIAQEKANTIAAGMINDLVKAILGTDGTGADIKALLDGFASSVSTLETSIAALDAKIGDISDLKDAQNPDIAAMIKNIKDELAGLADIYAAKIHTHSQEDIDGLIDALGTISDDLDTVSGKLDTLDTYVRETLVNRINELNAKFADYTTPTAVNELIAAAENILAAAIMSGDGFNSYFASLNLNALNAAIQDILDTDIANIIKDGGTIDTKAQALIDAAIEALNISQYLTVAGFDEEIVKYATNESVASSIAVATAIAALQVEFETGNVFTYADFDDAVEYLYGLLQDHIGDFTAAQIAFDSLKDRVDAIEPLIGEGFSKDFTIKDAIDDITGDIDEINTAISGINALFGNLGDGNTVESLIGGLQDLYDALINALLGVAQDGNVSGITVDHSLPTLKGRIDALESALGAIGFDTIKTTIGEKEVSLGEVIDGINGQISDLSATIGKGYDKDNTVADALDAFKTALADYVKGSVYEETVGGIEKDLQDLIDALTGKTNGATTDVENLSELSTKLAALISRLDNFNETTSKDIETFFNELKDRLDTIEGLVGTLPDGKDWSDLASVIDEMYTYIYSEGFSGKIYDNAAEALRARMGVTELLNNIGELKNLKTTAKTSLVAAINELFTLISAKNITQKDLTDLKLSILFGDDKSGKYDTLKALEDAIELLSAAIGESGDFDYKDIFTAIAALQSAVDGYMTSIGTNNTGYESIWDAIAALKDLAGMSGDDDSTLANLLHSMSFISDYADGKATVPCSSDKTTFGDLVLLFNVVADSRFDLDNYDVSVLVRGVRTRAEGEASYEASASIEGNVMTVTLSKENVKKAMSDAMTGGKDAVVVAVEISDGSDKFASPYIPVYFTNKYIRPRSSISGLTPGENGGYVAAYASKHTYSGIFDFDLDSYTVESDQTWATLSQDLQTISLEENTSEEERECTFTVTATDGSGVSTSLSVTQPSKKLTATKSGSSTPAESYKLSYNTYCYLTIANNFEYTGGYKVTSTSGTFRNAPYFNSNTLTFRTARYSNDWKGGSITISTNDNKCSLTITLTN